MISVVNTHKIVQNVIPEKQLPKTPLRLLVSHPRSVKNAYQFLEGTSMLAHIALHPESFPTVPFSSHSEPQYKNLLLVANNREQTPNDWNQHALQILLNMFPEDRRPTVLKPYSDSQFNGRNQLCDRIIVTRHFCWSLDVCS